MKGVYLSDWLSMTSVKSSQVNRLSVTRAESIQVIGC